MVLIFIQSPTLAYLFNYLFILVLVLVPVCALDSGLYSGSGSSLILVPTLLIGSSCVSHVFLLLSHLCTF